MLFFRRRDTLSQSHLTDKERCIHACLFFAFILLILTIVLFYFAATNKGTNEQRLYYYIGAGICLICLLLITFCTIISMRQFYGSSTQQRGLTSISEHSSSRYPSQHV
jgi:glycopeptide antibiotics resistance protein